LTDEWNLIEEVARMRGYDKVIAEAPDLPLVLSDSADIYAFEDRLKDFLSASGGTEVMNYSFLSPQEEGMLHYAYKMYSLANPLNPEESILRASLLPGLVKAAVANIRTKLDIYFFEVGNIFWKGKSAPIEQTTLGWVQTTPYQDASSAFFAAKEELERLLDTFALPARRYEASDSPLLEKGASAAVFIGKQKVAEVGLISKKLSSQYSKQALNMIGAEIFLEPIQALILGQETVFQPISRFPVATRDISLAVSKHVTAEKIETVLQKYGAPLLQSFTLFDIFEKDESKRFGYHLSFGLSDRTMTSEEMDAAFQKIVMGAKIDLGATL
jgi:phenylalanyl-tRNA synthetase beta chain